MFESYPTACLKWLSQVLDTWESGLDFPELEVGLYYWAEQLLPVLKTLYDSSQASAYHAAQAMAEYCELCLELCDAMSQGKELEFFPIPEWKRQLERARSAFLRAEQELGESRWGASLVA